MNKRTLRKHYLAERKKLSDEQIAQASRAICRQFFARFPPDALRNLHCFLPIHQQKEVDTKLIIGHIHRFHPEVTVVIPKVNGDHLENYVWNSRLELASTPGGIPEPVAGDGFPTERIASVLVPLVIFDQRGHRVGYGKGYYDRFLAECRPGTVKIGLSVFEPVAAIPEPDEWDVRLNYCVTPRKVWVFPAPA
ncbi:MAG: 5-formyltetrahydrofolate cyclo-ligase [Ferruginibacter sp.]|nr:5-formyltetrahydrofolate cyclo-ligase [Cytophagales bacterium]